MPNADQVIAALGLRPLEIEGGYFRETYRAPVAALTEAPRACATLIYYLLRDGGRSAWHKVASDEIWLYHTGTSAVQFLVFPDDHWEERRIGGDVLAGEAPQSLIPAGTWQTAALVESRDGTWGLFGALVVPGFEYADFVAGEAMELARDRPAMAQRMRAAGFGEM